MIILNYIRYTIIFLFQGASCCEDVLTLNHRFFSSNTPITVSGGLPWSARIVYQEPKDFPAVDGGYHFFTSKGLTYAPPLAVYEQDGVLMDIDKQIEGTAFVTDVRQDYDLAMWNIEAAPKNSMLVMPQDPANLLVMPGREKYELTMTHKSKVIDTQVHPEVKTCECARMCRGALQYIIFSAVFGNIYTYILCFMFYIFYILCLYCILYSFFFLYCIPHDLIPSQLASIYYLYLLSILNAKKTFHLQSIGHIATRWWRIRKAPQSWWAAMMVLCMHGTWVATTRVKFMQKCAP